MAGWPLEEGWRGGPGPGAPTPSYVSVAATEPPRLGVFEGHTCVPHSPCHVAPLHMHTYTCACTPYHTHVCTPHEHTSQRAPMCTPRHMYTRTCVSRRGTHVGTVCHMCGCVLPHVWACVLHGTPALCARVRPVYVCVPRMHHTFAHTTHTHSCAHRRCAPDVVRARVYTHAHAPSGRPRS